VRQFDLNSQTRWLSTVKFGHQKHKKTF